MLGRPSAPSDIVLSASGLTKRYGDIEAVRGISLDVRRGSCIGLIGPNGAGKSTTIEMLEGLTAPTSGEVRFNGRPLDGTYRERIGIVFQSTALQDHLSVGQTLRFFAGLYRQRRDLGDLARRCQIDGLLDRDPARLSGGQRQRLLLAIALVNQPELIFLDEPSAGLDPQARRALWDLLIEIRGQGVTVLMTTHYMDEAWALCDELALVDHGLIIARGTPHHLLANHGAGSVIELPCSETASLEAAMIPFRLVGGSVVVAAVDVGQTIEHLRQSAVSLQTMRVRSTSLDELFLAMTNRKTLP